MSYFNWMTWIAPENAKLGAITGSVSGLGLNPLPTFDWNQIVVITDPLISPFFVSAILPRVVTHILTPLTRLLTDYDKRKAPLLET